MRKVLLILHNFSLLVFVLVSFEKYSFVRWNIFSQFTRLSHDFVWYFFIKASFTPGKLKSEFEFKVSFLNYADQFLSDSKSIFIRFLEIMAAPLSHFLVCLWLAAIIPFRSPKILIILKFMLKWLPPKLIEKYCCYGSHP